MAIGDGKTTCWLLTMLTSPDFMEHFTGRNSMVKPFSWGDGEHPNNHNNAFDGS